MDKYSSSSIKVLQGLEPVRQRPSMFIGDTGERGLHHLIQEVVDNSIDEAMAGHCTKIDVRILEDGSCEVSDNGRGIPVDMHPTEKVSAVQVVLTKLHAGGKFDRQSYKVSGGLHGVGVSVVNALSSLLEVTVDREGHKWEQAYVRGVPKTSLQKRGKTNKNGTRIKFYPDKSIFGDLEFDPDRVQERLQELSFLNRGLKITFVDDRHNINKSFLHKEGIVEFVEFLGKKHRKLHQEPIYIAGKKRGLEIEVALQWFDYYAEEIKSYANNIPTVEGGTHLQGLKTSLTRALNTFGKKKGLVKKKIPIESDDSREGLVGIISVKVPEPQFEGQTKTKLGNSDIVGAVSELVYERLLTFFDQNVFIGRKIVNKALDAARARAAARKARDLERKKTPEKIKFVENFADCQEKQPHLREVFLVEGDSAGGSAKQGRDRKNQAILPLKGKIMNVWKHDLGKVLKSKELKTLIQVIGVNISESKNVHALRYHKIIIMTDADVDGSHIRTLLLTFFYRYYIELIERGHIYIAQPPLFRVKRRNKTEYFQSEHTLDDYVIKNGKQGLEIQRFKGLGEMNPEQLWSTTMDPQTRQLLQVRIQDCIEIERVMGVLMGEDIESRRDYIEEHALNIRTLSL